MSRFIKDTSGAFQSLYIDSVTGIKIGILTIGRGKRRKNVWHIFSINKNISEMRPTFKDAKRYVTDNTEQIINTPIF